MKPIQEVLREVLRRLYMGRRTEAYWRALRSLEHQRYGYDSRKKGKPNGYRNGH